MSYRLRIIFWGLILSALLIEISGCATRGGRGIVGPEGASFKPSDYKIKRICLDAGHGGKDPGALGRRYGLKEKFVVLDIVRRMKKMLTAEGIEVVTTRDKDVFVPLDKRARVANMAGVDLFLSIHANAHRRRGVSGFEAYYISDKADDAARALSLAKDNIPFPDSYILTEGSGRPRQAAFMRRLPRDVKATVWDLVLTENRIQSVELADYICRVSETDVGVKILGVKGARFAVLRRTQMPAVLVEVGFVSNAREEKRLSSAFYRQKIARAIVAGILSYARK